MPNQYIYIKDSLKARMDKLPRHPWTAIAIEAFLKAVETSEAAERSGHNPREVWEHINSPEMKDRLERICNDPLSEIWPGLEEELLAAKRTRELQHDTCDSIAP